MIHSIPGVLLFSLLLGPIFASAQSSAAGANELSILATGAVGDGTTLNTVAIQKAIDQLSAQGGGTVVVPAGRFLTGAIFLKPGVNLHLEKKGVLLGSTHIEDYPSRPTRIEGHTQVWRPALLNADHCDGVRITGNGTVQGGGKPFWEAFWSRLHADRKTKNLDVDRPRNLFISDSRNVLIQGISLRDSGFWNLHLYRCQNVTVEKVDIQTPPGSPSTDGIDVDSCQDVTIRGCHISVDDDDIALKGTKGPLADQDTESPPVERIRISDCTFGLGHGVLTLGSEACQVRDVVMENCRIEGPTNNGSNVVLRLKLRPDTPQHYEDIHVRNITLHDHGNLISIEPWTQYFDLKGNAPPKQLVENITLSSISGSTIGFGIIAGPPESTLRNITLQDIDAQLQKPAVRIKNVEGLTLKNVKINGKVLDAADLPSSELMPKKTDVMAALVLANDYFMKQWPDPGQGIPIPGKPDQSRPSTVWTRAVYYEGLMALNKVHPEQRYLDYAERWGESHHWMLSGGSNTRNADNQCCGQTYLALYAIDKKPEQLQQIKESIDGMLATDKVNDWSWIDALQMAMPVFAKLGVITGDDRYLERMHAMYEFTRDQEGGHGLYNPTVGLWWRDKSFLPPYKEPNGKDCYWSRGNGWVVAAMARVLQILPANKPHRAEYEKILVKMCEALAPLQRADGFWNVSLNDPTHFGGKELTGTALFTYGMAYGINHGLLDHDRFIPIVAKAWNGMMNDGLQHDGRLAYMQGTGKEPKDGQPVTFDSKPNFEDYGLGCFLLAGSEVSQLLNAPSIRHPQP